MHKNEVVLLLHFLHFYKNFCISKIVALCIFCVAFPNFERKLILLQSLLTFFKNLAPKVHYFLRYVCPEAIIGIIHSTYKNGLLLSLDLHGVSNLLEIDEMRK